MLKSRRDGESGMWRMVIAMLFLGAPAFAERSDQGTGFTCRSSTSETHRFNIDLKKRRYDAGEGTKKIGAITDTKITLEAQNPDLMSDNGGPSPDCASNGRLIDVPSICYVEPVSFTGVS